MKTSELIGPALSWAVAKCEALRTGHSYAYTPRGKLFINSPLNPKGRLVAYSPSTNWSQGGSIIERECIETRHDGRKAWCAWHKDYGAIFGTTLLIAAMRCYVASRLGDEVDIPEELK